VLSFQAAGRTGQGAAGRVVGAGLAPAGLVFNQTKTRIVRLDEGFEFLGFHLRRYRNGKLLIKPSVKAITRFRKG
jgi:RNA-directed DNA polymerase